MSASSSALGEAAFAALPKTLRAKIDDAFTSVSLSNPPHRQTHSETHSSLAPAAPSLGGGGGGFILEETVIEPEAQGATTTNASARIPLASIPAALALLDLPPHDRQILAVFRDAAESDDEDEDNAAEYGVNGANGKEMSVSRSQWRAVCAVLLEGSSDPSPSPSSPSPSPSPSSPSSRPSPSSPARQREERKTRPRRSKAAYTPISPSNRTDAAYESGDDSEPYVASDDSDHSLQQDKDQYDDDEEEDGDDSDYEYTGRGASRPSTSKPSKSTKSTNKSKSRSKANANANPNAPPDPTAALAAFALFFPSFPSTPAHDPTPHDPTPRDPTELKDNSNELKDRKITLRDLQAAMKRAGEKYKADDLTEMLALFSTSPDTSNPVSFADFGRIMRAAGLA